MFSAPDSRSLNVYELFSIDVVNVARLIGVLLLNLRRDVRALLRRALI